MNREFEFELYFCVRLCLLFNCNMHNFKAFLIALVIFLCYEKVKKLGF